MSQPLAIDLYCGLGGWTEGLLAEGYRVVGYDIEAHEYGEDRYPGELRLADVLTLDGAQFRDAALIVASPPCQEYSYMVMPWTRAKAKARAIREDMTGSELERLNRLFNACFRIQREASEAAGRHVPMVVENVRGAQPWVGPAAWNFGSYYLWGDVPALMPQALRAQKFNPDGTKHGQGSWFAIADSKNRGIKNTGGAHRRDGAPHTRHLTHPAEGRKHGGSWFNDPTSPSRQGGQRRRDPMASCASKSPARKAARKAASAKIAKIPFTLSSWIGRTYWPADAIRGAA